MALKRYPKSKLLKFYAEQLKLSILPLATEPHTVVRCCKCDEAKRLEFRTTGNGELYYVCPCGFESEPLGEASAFRKGFDIP